MTALKKYQKLECSGLWRGDPTTQRREVTVNLGGTSLVLSDPKRDVALSHWSLPAIQRLNGSELPAVFAPGPDAEETLELTDTDMIAALETVHSALEAARPHPGRLRNGFLASVAIGIVALGVFWLPDALVNHTVSVLPAAARAEMGRVVLADLTRLTGQPCSGRRGQQALAQLSTRIFGPPNPPRLYIVRQGIKGALLLPSQQIVLSEALIAEQDGPELAAGHALVEQIGLEMKDPMGPLLHYAGLRATFTLLTTGALPPSAIAGYAETLIQTAPDPLPQVTLLTRFEAARIPTSPYAYMLDPTGETVLGLIEGDPFANVVPPRLLPDDDWVSLQEICAS